MNYKQQIEQKAKEYLKPYHLSYKDPSDRSSYSQYREGYSDAMDIAEQAIKQAQKDAYNQALIDAALLAKVEYVMVQSGNNPEYEYEYQVDKQSILKLKK